MMSPVRVGFVAVVTTAAMTVSMLPLFVLGALAPTLVAAYGVVPSTLGVLVAAGFGVSTMLSLPAGSLVDRLGPRRCLVALFVLSACALAVIAAARAPWTALLGVATGGVPQALANPATNKTIMAAVPAERRASLLGWKQSGVQLGAFVAGIPLTGLAAVVSWRWCVAALAIGCLCLALLAARSLPHDPAGSRSHLGSLIRQSASVWTLAVFSVALGIGVVSVNTFLAVYAAQRVGASQVVSGALVALLGVAGVVGRIGWNRVAGRRSDPGSLLPLLAAAAAVSTAAVAAAVWSGPFLWLGAAGIGLFGVAANAVSMLVVVRTVAPERTGQATAVVSAGFFGGFAVGPLLSGALLHLGYGWMWGGVACAFVLAAGIASRVLALRRREVVRA